MISKAPGMQYVIPVTSNSATALAADETYLYVATASSITRFQIQ